MKVKVTCGEGHELIFQELFINSYFCKDPDSVSRDRITSEIGSGFVIFDLDLTPGEERKLRNTIRLLPMARVGIIPMFKSQLGYMTLTRKIDRKLAVTIGESIGKMKWSIID